jgi:hypothetical protein
MRGPFASTDRPMIHDETKGLSLNGNISGSLYLNRPTTSADESAAYHFPRKKSACRSILDDIESTYQ